jgi:hypothetical protein
MNRRAFITLLGGGGNLPRSHVPQSGDENPTAATSNRSAAIAAPQWQQTHGSRPVTPEPQPERPSEQPTIKSAATWLGVIRDVQKRFGLSMEETIHMLNQIPLGRALLHKATS